MTPKSFTSGYNVARYEQAFYTVENFSECKEVLMLDCAYRTKSARAHYEAGIDRALSEATTSRIGDLTHYRFEVRSMEGHCWDGFNFPSLTTEQYKEEIRKLTCDLVEGKHSACQIHVFISEDGSFEDDMTCDTVIDVPSHEDDDEPQIPYEVENPDYACKALMGSEYPLSMDDELSREHMRLVVEYQRRKEQTTMTVYTITYFTSKGPVKSENKRFYNYTLAYKHAEAMKTKHNYTDYAITHTYNETAFLSRVQ